MTTFSEIIDIAMIGINDYELNISSISISEENFNLIQSSISYAEYVAKCESAVPEFIEPVSSKRYDYIKVQNYFDYASYLADMERILLNKLYAFLVKAIPNFDNCPKMASVDYDKQLFNEELTDIEKSILADLTILAWYERENNDIRQFRAMIQNKSEANRYSEGNLLKERTNRETSMKEAIDVKKAKYDLKNNFKVGSWEF